MILKRLQLGLIHVAVAMTLVPINSTLNRVMIKELALSAALVAVLASLPYLFSPIQVAIGSFADRHPLFGRRRTPYIIIGLLFCFAGVTMTPHAAFFLAEEGLGGLWVGLLAFGAWGMGYNFATVSYLSLASEISGEEGRGKTVAIMWFMMIVGIIVTAIVLGNLVDPYTPRALVDAFWRIGIASLLLGTIGLLNLEGRTASAQAASESHYSWRQMFGAILENRQAKTFFIYLVILLAAILGQDILLEPYAAEAFDMPVKTTTRITSLWGGCVLITLAIAGALDRRTSKKSVAIWGGAVALAGFVLIAFSGTIFNQIVFYAGVVMLGLGTGLSTVSNLSLMLDMTTVSNVGLFIGAWGMASAVSRFVGSIVGGVLRDSLTALLAAPIYGYVLVFSLEAGLLFCSLLILRRIDVAAFRDQAQNTGLMERAALATET